MKTSNETLSTPNCPKRIGVLGGIGPEATAEFYLKLIRTLQMQGVIKRNEDFPQILINSIPAPALIYDAISDEELRSYIDGLKELDCLWRRIHRNGMQYNSSLSPKATSGN